MVRAEITGGRILVAKIFYDPFTVNAKTHLRQPKRRTVVELFEEIPTADGFENLPLAKAEAANHITEQFEHAAGRTVAFRRALTKAMDSEACNLNHEDFAKFRSAFLAKCPTSKKYWA